MLVIDADAKADDVGESATTSNQCRSVVGDGK